MYSRLGDRSLFPDLEAAAYLNHAAISPPSTLVAAAAREVLEIYARRGLGALYPYLEQRERLRTKLATLIGGTAAEIGFVPNTTSGVITIAQSFPWRRGDAVAVLRGEFPANVTPWQRAAKLHDLRVEMLDVDDFADDPGIGLQRLEDAMRRGVRLVAVSAVQFQTGLRMPLRSISEVCRRHDAALFVDAIQACGVVPIDAQAMGIDFISCGSHKWLMGLEGAAFVYIAERFADRMQPHHMGWLSHEDGLRFLFEGPGHLRYDRGFRTRADSVEVGAYNVIGFAALEPAVDVLLELGVATIFEHVQRYHDAAEPLLLARGFESRRASDPAGRSGILSFVPPPNVSVVDLPAAFASNGVAVTIPDGLLRLAPHWPNALTEMSVIEAAAAQLG